MHPDLMAALVAEHHRNLLADADRRRLAAVGALSPGLRPKLGRYLVSVGMRISGTHPCDCS